MSQTVTIFSISTDLACFRIKSKRAAKKRAKAELAAEEERHERRETYFQSTKAQEVEDERRRTNQEELEAMGDPGPSRVHPALRGQYVEAPPPYVKDAPSYEEHHLDERAGSSSSQ